MSGTDLTDARLTVKAILDGMKVTTVVSVDDYYISPDELYVTLLSTLVNARRDHKLDQVGAALPADIRNSRREDMFLRKVRAYWEGLTDEGRLDLIDRTTGGSVSSSDLVNLDLLSGILPSEVQFYRLTPQQWQERRETLIGVAGPDSRLLCLFDQNLKMANLPDTGGVTLLKGALTTNSPHMVCGLLTQVVRTTDEMTELRALAKAADLRLDEFLLISKDRLQSGPEHFADGLKLLWLNSLRERLTKELHGISQDADTDARVALNELDVYEFDHVVLRSSEEEGLWEAQTLVRIHDILRRKTVQKRVHQERRAEFAALSDQIRTIREIRIIDTPQYTPSDRVLRLRLTELFESGEIINQTHVPLDVGDIFLVSNKRYYVMLAQPCDMMIRKTGSRSAKVVALVQVKPKKKREAAAPVPGSSGAEEIGLSDDTNSLFEYELDYFGDFVNQPSTSYVVKFREAFRISLNVLDLATYSGDGKCVFPPPNDIEFRLHAPLRAHVEKLTNHWQGEQEQLEKNGYANLDPYLQKAIRYRLTLVDDLEGFSFKVTQPSGPRLEFPIQRIGRLREPRCTRLLNSYTDFQSRPAEEHDYASVSRS